MWCIDSISFEGNSHSVFDNGEFLPNDLFKKELTELRKINNNVQGQHNSYNVNNLLSI